MDIQYDDQREDVANEYLVAMLARLTISPTIVDYFRQAQVDDELLEQWFDEGTYSGLIKDAYSIYG